MPKKIIFRQIVRKYKGTKYVFTIKLTTQFQHWSTRGVQKVREILEHFRCMTGNTGEFGSHCSAETRRQWHSALQFGCSPLVPSECSCCTGGLHTKDDHINARSCSSFHSSYRTVSKNHCLSTLHVLFVCGAPTCQHRQQRFGCFWTFRSTRTHFTVTDSSVHTWQLSMDLCHFHSFRQKNRRTLFCLSLVQTSSALVTGHKRMTVEPYSRHVTT